MREGGNGWFDVDYQREINRGQIRSRRRTLARFALFTAEKPMHPIAMRRATRKAEPEKREFRGARVITVAQSIEYKFNKIATL